MKYQNYKTTTAVFAVLMLAACGGSGSSDPEMMQDGALFAVLPDGSTQSVNEAFTAGVTLTADGADTTALELDFNNDVTTPVESTFSLTSDGNGGVVVVNNGMSTSFSATQREGDDGFEIDNPGVSFVGVFGQSNNIQEILNGDDAYSGAVSYLAFPENGDPTPIVSYNVLGARTAPDVMPSSTAVYGGGFKIETLPATGFDSFGDSRTRIRGDAELRVSTSGAISGVLSDITVQAPGSNDRTDFAGTIAMSSSQITDGTFSGDLTADATLVSSLTGLSDPEVGTYAGRLYGPAAEEAAGTLTLQADGSEGPVNGVGFFRGED
ncbi:hypothetical protein [Yoonia sp. 208BN28-4]|uniref:hypothetical protein n=1 Tax=Yoonia sp. 208BN28-4 TaxID=3126505 RepID=UPI0030A6333B